MEPEQHPALSSIHLPCRCNGVSRTKDEYLDNPWNWPWRQPRIAPLQTLSLATPSLFSSLLLDEYGEPWSLGSTNIKTQLSGLSHANSFSSVHSGHHFLSANCRQKIGMIETTVYLGFALIKSRELLRSDTKGTYSMVKTVSTFFFSASQPIVSGYLSVCGQTGYNDLDIFKQYLVYWASRWQHRSLTCQWPEKIILSWVLNSFPWLSFTVIFNLTFKKRVMHLLEKNI